MPDVLGIVFVTRFVVLVWCIRVYSRICAISPVCRVFDVSDAEDDMSSLYEHTSHMRQSTFERPLCVSATLAARHYTADNSGT